jgi:hypothetical protein
MKGNINEGSLCGFQNVPDVSSRYVLYKGSVVSLAFSDIVYECMGNNPAHMMTCLKDDFSKDK